MSRYAEIIAKRKADRETSLRSSLYSAADANPDEEAFFSSLSQKTGLPVEALRNDKGAEGKRLQTVQQADTLLTQAPQTAAWMAKNENARHGHDDIDNLAATEDLFIKRGTVSTLGMASEGDQELARGAKKAVGFALPTAVQSVKTAPLRFAQGINEALAGVGELTGYYALLRGTGIDKDPAAFLRDNMDIYAQNIRGIEEVQPQTRAQANVKMATDSIATSLMTAPAAVAGRIPQLAAFAVSAPGQLFDYIDAGYHPVQAAAFSAMNKVMEGATEMIGVGKLFQPGSFAKKASGFVVGDLFGEEINNAYSQLQAKGTLQPDLTLEEFTKSAVDTAVVTIMAGGIQGAATAPLAAMSGEYQRAAKAQQNMDFMLALGDSAKSAKLLQRMPAKYKEFIQAIKQQGDVENVFIDADKFQTFFQSQGVDPQQMAESIGAANEYAQALAVGGEMVIPLEDYAMHLAGTDYHAELSKDLRLHPDVMSYHEAEKFKGEIPGQLDSLLKEVTDGEGETASKKVYDDIYQGLTAVGRDDATARFEALIQTSRVNTLAEQSGRDAWELWQENPIKFKRETFMTRKDFIDTTVDPLLDRLRGKENPSEGKVFGTSALTLLRTKGLQEHGDLAKMDVDKDLKKFTRKLIRPDGLTLDAAGELLWEAGYFQERPTEREVLDAIDREMRGDPLYSDKQTDNTALQMSADLEEMQMFLDQNNIDLATMSNLEVRDALAKVTEGEMFNQSLPDKMTIDGVERWTVNSNGKPIAQTEEGIRNFWAWFGESKVVDEQGRPLVVYHGTGVNFEEFKRGVFETAIFFSPSTDFASKFADKGNAQVLPVYLRMANPFDFRKSEQVDGLIDGLPEKEYTAETRNSLSEKIKNGEWKAIETLDIQDAVKAAGYDGYYTTESLDGEDAAINYAVFGSAQIKSAIGNAGTFDPQNPNILYQSGSLPRLIVNHNLSSENLIFADKIGGLAVPSLAITPETVGHESYGEITLIGTEELADPAKESVVDADAYSATFPTPEYPKVPTKVAQKVVDSFRDIATKFAERHVIDTIWDNAVNTPNPGRSLDDLSRYSVVKAKFLKDVLGIDVDPVMRPVTRSMAWTDTEAWREFFKSAKWEDENLGFDDPKRIKLRVDASAAAKKAIKEYVSGEKLTESGEPPSKKIRQQLIETYSGKRTFGEDGILVYSAFEQARRDYEKAEGKSEVDRGKTQELVDQKLSGHEAAFKAWLDKTILGMYGEPMLKVNGKKVPYTLNNIVEFMTAKKLRGAESTMTFGAGQARAVVSRQFKELEEMRQAAAENIMSKKDLDASRKQAEEQLGQFRDQVAEFYTGRNYRGEIDYWNAFDDAMKAIARWAKNGAKTEANLKAALVKEGFKSDVPAKVLKLGVEAGRAMLVAPVPYFEGKPQRAVKLKEFAGAVVPDDVSPEVLAILEKNGIKVRKYGNRFDETARHETAITLRRELQAKGFKTLFQDDKRASITFLPTHRQIELFKGADASSVIHEFSHSWLEELKRDGQAGVNEQVKADWETAAKHIGIDPAATSIPVEAHEKFADTGITYVAEGKAPSVELIPVFQRFKAQLMLLYKRAKIALLPMNDEIRGVFDRLLASKEQTAEARRQQGFVPLILTAESAGMTERGFAAYRKAMEKAHLAAEESLQQKLMREMAREDLVWWKEAEAKMKEEVTKEAQQEPLYDAFQALSTGKTFAGDDAPEGFKIDRAALEKTYGKEWVKNLPRWFKKGIGEGMHPDEVAEVFGFSSGDDMIQQMINALPYRQFVDAETSRRMLRDHGDMMTDGRLPEEAMQAVHTDMQAEVLHAELKALKTAERQSRPAVKAAFQDAKAKARAARDEAAASLPPLDAFRTWASQAIGNMPVGKLRPSSYLRAERKAANAAQELYQKQKFAEAAEEKQKQIANMFLYREAVKAQDDEQSAQTFMKRMEKPRAQSVLGLAGQDYQDTMNGLLDEYEFKKVTNKELDYRASLAGLIERLKENGRDASLIEGIQVGLKRNYRTLTVDELRGVHDMAKFIYHNAKTAHDFMLGEERFGKEIVRQEVIGSIRKNAKQTVGSMENDSGLKSIMNGVGELITNSFTADTVLFKLDGWKRLGPVYRHVKGIVDEAVASKLLPMQDQAARDIEAIYSVYSSAELKAMHSRKFFVPELNGSFSKSEIMEIAHHQGNAGNKEAIISSRVAVSNGLTQEKVDAILARVLDERDWKFVQARLDYLESYWAKIEEKQRRLKGIVPGRVTPTPIETPFGTLRGGYYPLKYDSGKSVNAAQDSAEEFFTSVRQGRFSWAQTAHGHTIERVGSGGRAVSLKDSTFHSHVNSVIVDLAMGEAINFSAQVLNDAQIKAAFEDTGTVAVRRYLDVWLTDTAMGEKVGDDVISRSFRYIRTGIAAKSMLFNVGSGLVQYSGILQTAGTIGIGNTVQGMRILLGKPWTGENSVGLQIARMSPFMAKREDTFHKDMMDLISSFKNNAARKFINDYGMLMIKKLQHHVDLATWLAAHYQASNDEKIDADPIAYADRMVARAQGSGIFSDRSAMERGSLGQNVRQNEVVRSMTTLLSYQIAKFNVAAEKVGSTSFKDPLAVIHLASDMILLYAMDVAVTMLIRGVWPGGDDDDESWLWKLTKKSVSSVLSGIPAMREVTSVFEGFGSGGTIGTLGEAMKRVYDQSAQGEMDAPLIKSVNNLGGILFRYPSSAINRFGDALNRDLDGEDVDLIEYFIYQEDKK